MPRPAHNRSSSPRRFVPTRPAGIVNRSAPFWTGARAETIVNARQRAIAHEKAAKRAAKDAKRGTTRRDANGQRVRTPSAQLKRLQRALLRRKTLAGRQSVERRIAQLQRAHPEL